MHDTVDKLIEITNIQLPDTFMKRWLLETNNEKLTKEKVDEQYEQSKNALKWQLLENKIITENNIHVSEEDVKKYIKESIRLSYFSHLEADSPMLDNFVETIMKNKEEVKNTYDRMYDEKLTELFINTLHKNNKSVTFEEFVKIISEHKHQHGDESHEEHHHD